jgi:predicted unusual protein kinase regulating ubiquinone biosynthesis (AarF/ABC1/UbiB family)
MPRRPDEPEGDDLGDLFGESQDGVPTSLVGRFGRLAGMVARTAAAAGFRRLTGGEALDAKLAERVALSLGELKGLAMKGGQILSYTDASLPEEVRRVLATLQTSSPPIPFSSIETVVKEELGARADELLSRMERRPIAAASIGQVHRATLADGKRVAVKVQYPGMEKALATEFRAAGAGAQLAKLIAPAASVEAFIAEAKERVLEECDYEREALSQRRFGEIFARHKVLRVPRVFDELSSRRVLTTEWIDGLRYDAWLAKDPSQEERNRVGVSLYELYVGTLLKHGLFDADPHPGNYLFPKDGRLVVLDYGCVRRFTPDQVAAYVALREAVKRDDPLAMRDALRGLGAGEPAGAKAWETARTLLRAFFGPTLEDRIQRIPPTATTGAAQLLSDKRAIAQLSLPGACLFLFRIKFGLHAVLSRIGAEANWSRLEDGFTKPRARRGS